MARKFLLPWIYVLEMGSSSHLGLIIAPGQEANGDDLIMVFCVDSLESPRLDDSNEHIKFPSHIYRNMSFLSYR